MAMARNISSFVLMSFGSCLCPVRSIISIHALVGGELGLDPAILDAGVASIHAPVGGANFGRCFVDV